MKPVFLTAILFFATATNFLIAKEELSRVNLNCFQENKGQVVNQDKLKRSDVLYYGEAQGFNFYLTKSGISYQQYKPSNAGKTSVYRVDIGWVGANPSSKVVSGSKYLTKNNFYNTPDGVPIIGASTFNDITYKDLYNHIDLRYYFKGDDLKYDYIVRPHGDYHTIKLKIEGGNVALYPDGSVSITTPFGVINEGKPIAYQEGREIGARWKVNANELSFELWGYDDSKEVVIDPLVYNWSYKVGYSYQIGVLMPQISFYHVSHYGSAIDNTGYIYACGKGDNSGGYPHGFVVKQSLLGSNVGSVTISMDSPAFDVSTDSLGNVFVCGATSTSPLIATSGSHQTTLLGTTDAYVIMFQTNPVSNSFGKVWGTYYGGANEDTAWSCKPDKYGSIYVAGKTSSYNNIATSGSFQQNHGGGTYDGFIVRFDTNGVRKWGTYFGGNGIDYCKSLSIVDSMIFVSGSTMSAMNIASTNSFQDILNGVSNGFLAQFDTSGVRQWGTYYGNDSTYGNQCTADDMGVYLCGYTTGTAGIATAGAYQATNAGFKDAYLAKFTFNGTRLWATYFGGSKDDFGVSCTANNRGQVYLGGSTGSHNGIGMFGTFNSAPLLGWTYNEKVSFLAEFDTTGRRLWSSYCDTAYVANSISTDIFGSVVMVGVGNSFGYYPTSPVATMTKFSRCYDTTAIITAPTNDICPGETVLLSTALIPNATYKWYRNKILAHQGIDTAGNTYNVFKDGTYKVIVNGCTNGVDTGSLVVATHPRVATGIYKHDVPCYGLPKGSISVYASSGTPPYSYSWSNLPDTTPVITNLPPGTYYPRTTDIYNCFKIDTVKIVTSTTSPPSSPLAAICAVTTDTNTGKNLIIWEKKGDIHAMQYKVYRESSINGQYDLIGINDLTQFSTFIDTSANPAQQSYNYSISEVDSCNKEWPMSQFHKTIHLAANIGVNGEINLNWNNYEGKAYTTHYIMRSVGNSAFTLLNQVSSGTNAYTDLTPPAGLKKYRIDIDLPTQCAPSKTTTGARITSNILSLFPVKGIVIMPNPTRAEIEIVGATPDVVRLYDAIGRLVFQQSNTNKINIGQLAEGIYVIKLFDKNGLLLHQEKVVKQ